MYLDPVIVHIERINDMVIEIYSQSDYEFKGHRHSYSVISKRGTSVCGGYGESGEIIHITVELALMDAFKYVFRSDELVMRRREFSISKLLKHTKKD